MIGKCKNQVIFTSSISREMRLNLYTLPKGFLNSGSVQGCQQVGDGSFEKRDEQIKNTIRFFPTKGQIINAQCCTALGRNAQLGLIKSATNTNQAQTLMKLHPQSAATNLCLKSISSAESGDVPFHLSFSGSHGLKLEQGFALRRKPQSNLSSHFSTRFWV